MKSFSTLFISLCVVALVSISGCGDGGTPPNNTPMLTAKEKLLVAHSWIGVWSSPDGLSSSSASISIPFCTTLLLKEDHTLQATIPCLSTAASGSWKFNTAEDSLLLTVAGIGNLKTTVLSLNSDTVDLSNGVWEHFLFVKNFKGFNEGSINRTTVNGTILGTLGNTLACRKEGIGISDSSVVIEDCAPNPLLDQTRISFTVRRTSSVRITLHAEEGVALRTILNNTLNTGQHNVQLDFQDGQGNALPKGLYRIYFHVNVPGAVDSGYDSYVSVYKL